MMKLVILSLFIFIAGSICLNGQPEATPPLAPLLPLTEEFPLGLNQANRNLIMEKIQQKETTRKVIEKELQERSFPWFTLAALMVCGGGGWFIYLMRDQLIEKNTKASIQLSLLDEFKERFKAMEKETYSKENCAKYYNQLSSLILHGIKLRSGWNTSSMTTIEIAQNMQRQSIFSTAQAKELLLLLIRIDEVKFTGEHPSEEQTIKFTQTVLKAVGSFIYRT